MTGTLEQLYGPNLNGPLNTKTISATNITNAWAGRTTLNSGSITVTVSTTHIQSDAIVLFGTEVNTIGLGANSGGAIVINSLSEGVSFDFARATGVAAPHDETTSWMIIRTRGKKSTNI